MTSVFDPDYTPPVETPEEIPDDPLTALVGEGKKFADERALAKAKIESDLFIEQLKAENAEIRKTLSQEEEAKRKLDAILERLSTQPKKSSEENQPRESTVADQQSDIIPKIPQSTEPVEETVQRLLSEREKQSQAQRNMAEVTRKMEEEFKGKAKDVIASKATELGVSSDWMKDIAAQNPSAFFTLIGIQKETTAPQPNVSPLHGDVNTEARSFNADASNVKNNAYWQEQRKKMGNTKFFSPAVQTQFFASLKELGKERFYG